LTELQVRTPKLVPGHRDLRSVPLSPTDGFVLSRIDGVCDELEITEVTGLPGEQVQACLSKLESLGVVTFDAAQPRPRPTARLAPPPSASSPTGLDDQVAPDGDLDLPPETQRLIVETHEALDRLDHYALLGISEGADKKELKRAYYGLAAKFHPDRYFRKKLGSYKFRMEAIFGRITIAHDTLSNKEARFEYDLYRQEQRRARGIEERLAEAITEAKRAEESIEREVRSQTPVAAPSSSSVPPPGSIPPPAFAAVASPLSPSPPSSVDASARRDVLARRLLGGRGAASSAPPPRISMIPPPTPTVADAMDALRRRYEERVSRAKVTQARKYVANGEAAVAKGDTVAAANAFRVAASLAPSDPDVERRAEEAQAKANAVLSETYTRQAEYEEKTGRWIEAARSWTRVCKARPDDAAAHERAANSLVKAGGDLHEAARLADRACALAPKVARYRVALANVYLAAGLVLNARRELDAAGQLAPHDDTIVAMMKRLGSRG
jgi:curved DNA-binding protein CbpA